VAVAHFKIRFEYFHERVEENYDKSQDNWFPG